MRYSEITEALNSPPSLQWSDLSGESANIVRAEFQISDGLFRVEFVNKHYDGGQWTVAFSRNGTHDLTGTGDQFAVMAGVMEACRTFIATYRPVLIGFEIKNTEASRHALYMRLANNAMKQFPEYRLFKKRDGSSFTYVVFERDRDPYVPEPKPENKVEKPTQLSDEEFDELERFLAQMNEGVGDDVIYHATDVPRARSIIDNNCILPLTKQITRPARGFNLEVTNMPFKAKDKQKFMVAGISTTRSIRYANLWKQGKGIIFVLDRNKVRANNRLVALSYNQRRGVDEREEFIVGKLDKLDRCLVSIIIPSDVYDEIAEQDGEDDLLLKHPKLKVIAPISISKTYSNEQFPKVVKKFPFSDL